MSIFAHRNTKTVDIPQSLNAAGDATQHSVVIRQLNPKQLEAASKESMRLAFSDARALGGFAVIQEELKAIKPDADKAKEKNPFLVYDRTTLMVRGIKSWTYDETLGEDAIVELPEEVQRLLATEVLRLTRPALLQDKAEAEAEAKNE